ncbi:hypothetical protein Z042_05700 [Chania multitudinisentens RB-25]|uniref:Fimbrial-type adhesion domain-containing protein n=2 Tax=Chania TaxID=1745211 RepID=W0L5T0_9GAMM|nr:hypothetical protein Z042_05700 [Chania multitudinisentens RB-25]
MRTGGGGKYRTGVLLGILLMSAPSVANMPVNIRGTVIIPPPCTINNNQTIQVDFGNEVMTTRIDGVNYKQAITYSLSCDIQKSNNLKMSIQGTAATFNSALLRTDKNGLGIALYHGAQPLNANTWFNYTYPSKPELYAVLVKQSGVTLTGGEFAASATLLIDYQ